MYGIQFLFSSNVLKSDRGGSLYSKVLLPQIQTCEFSLDKKKIIYDGSFISKMFCITPFPNVPVSLDFCIDCHNGLEPGGTSDSSISCQKGIEAGKACRGTRPGCYCYSACFPNIAMLASSKKYTY